ncbi:sushi, von Willebrand factor type A, EGF and pentraxin domain-containing protein 1-like isoform X1 [Chiloscyllium plagiosum]|uniref:sushi, von Willebrand factor type A, EGF and pentraxin domain-containing protein 1-like isoform X1 n=1 Tax=Chiloscyllium plagiosum TaxID=36176 RepID=UPI001CB80652|nr:sushi, von Willebrand factor type A, EGF and pentraxin domain-containing protein 1-like isoform X1 [Chiloscyllium plagiosum]
MFSTAKTCGHPKSLQNGYYTATGETFGDTATYYCNKGYQLLGKSMIQCTESGRSNGLGICDQNWRDQEETPCNHRQRTMCKKVHINPQPSENQVEANVNEYHDHPAGSLMRSNL